MYINDDSGDVMYINNDSGQRVILLITVIMPTKDVSVTF